VGHQSYTLNKATHCSETYHFAGSDETFDQTVDRDGHDSGSHTYVRDEIQIASWLHATAGIAYQRISYEDTIASATFEVSRWSPRLGIAARLTPSTRLRAAAFRQLHINLFGSSIAPPTISGFVIARNEFPTAIRDEYSLSVEHAARRVFVAVRGYFREATVPFLMESGSFVPEADANGAGAGVYANWIAHDRVTVFAENQFAQFGSTRFDRYDNLTRVGVNAIHPRGVFFRVAGSHVTQRFANTQVSGLPRSGFTLVDLRVAYEFAGKRGLLSLDVANAFNERFDAVIENLSIDSVLPRRRVVAELRWRLW
jgi:outer membrane receptor protein involved in Fe transport